MDNNNPNQNNQRNVKDARSRAKADGGKSPRKKLLWNILLFAIIALTIWAITSQEGFSIKEFWEYLTSLNPVFLILAILSMLAVIFFEALAILTIIKTLGQRQRFKSGFLYATSDLYFSAITPSSTGGQPASGYLMMKDGIPGTVATVGLLVNVIMYNLAIIIISVVTFLIKPEVVLGFSTLSKVLIIVGTFCLSCLALFSFIILYKSHFIQRVGHWFINLFVKIKLIRKPEKLRAKLDSCIESYDTHVSHLKGTSAMMLKVLLFNILQRVCNIAVTLFIYLASSENPGAAFDVWSAQCMVVIGTNMLPIPGAVGISDYLLIDSFGTIGFDAMGAVNLSLLSRTISFYFSVIVCGASLIIYAISNKIKEKKQEKDAENK